MGVEPKGAAKGKRWRITWGRRRKTGSLDEFSTVLEPIWRVAAVSVHWGALVCGIHSGTSHRQWRDNPGCKKSLDDVRRSSRAVHLSDVFHDVPAFLTQQEVSDQLLVINTALKVLQTQNDQAVFSLSVALSLPRYMVCRV